MRRGKYIKVGGNWAQWGAIGKAVAARIPCARSERMVLPCLVCLVHVESTSDQVRPQRHYQVHLQA